MTEIFNRKNFKILRQKLRNESPRAELLLWQKLRKSQIRDMRFHRQYSIANYIVDFYCTELRLVIEVDGGTHYQPDAIEKDKLRNDKLKSLSLTVLRFDNNDIYNNLIGVIDRIHEVIADSLNPS